MLRTMFALFFVCCLQGAAPQLTAAETVEQAKPQRSLEEYVDEESPSFHQVSDVRALFFKTFGLLAGLCGLVIVGGYALKRLAGPRAGALGVNGTIALIERKYISPKTALWLVAVNGQPFVVIDSQNGVAIHAIPAAAQPNTQQ